MIIKNYDDFIKSCESDICYDDKGEKIGYVESIHIDKNGIPILDIKLNNENIINMINNHKTNIGFSVSGHYDGGEFIWNYTNINKSENTSDEIPFINILRKGEI